MANLVFGLLMGSVVSFSVVTGILAPLAGNGYFGSPKITIIDHGDSQKNKWMSKRSLITTFYKTGWTDEDGNYQVRYTFRKPEITIKTTEEGEKLMKQREIEKDKFINELVNTIAKIQDRKETM